MIWLAIICGFVLGAGVWKLISSCPDMSMPDDESMHMEERPMDKWVGVMAFIAAPVIVAIHVQGGF